MWRCCSVHGWGHWRILIPELARQFEFWRTELAGSPEIVEIRVIGRGRRWRRWPVRMCRSRCPRRLSRVRALARVTGATEFMVVHAALAALVSRLAGTDDVVIGTPVAGRGDPETAGMVGMFVNTLVLRTPVDLAADAQTLVQVVRAADTLALDNADIPSSTWSTRWRRCAPRPTPRCTKSSCPSRTMVSGGTPGTRSRRRQPGHRADAGAAHHGSERPELCAGPRRDRWMDGIPPYATDLYDEESAQRLAQASRSSSPSSLRSRSGRWASCR